MSTIEEVVEFLHQKRLVVVTAESCTAGLVAAMLADVPGCGEVLEGGYITYTKTAKNDYLNVPIEVMESAGLTSETVARELVLGLRMKSKGNMLIAITGTAESDDELCGVVCFAFGLRSGSQVDSQLQAGSKLRIVSETRRFDGERNDVRKKAALYAIQSIQRIYHSLVQAVE